MRVSIGVEDELDAAFNSLLLLALANLIENSVKDGIDDSLFSHLDNCFDHLMLNLLILWIDSRLFLCLENRIISILYDNSVHNLLD